MSSDSDNIRPLSSWSDCLRESEEQLQAFYCDYGKFVMTLGPGYLSRPNMHQRATTVAMHQMLSTGKYSDLTVCCGLEVFKVHRAIVCPRSKFFAAACDGGFQVNHSHCYTILKVLD